jgi:glycogen operon protein
VLSFTLAGFDGEADIHVIMNMYWEQLEFELPTITGRGWHRAIDTALDSPDDILEPGKECPTADVAYLAQGRSVVVMISK